MSPIERALIDLERALGSGGLRTDDEARAAAAGDESGGEPQLPRAVLRPKTAQQVARALAIASRHRVPVTPRGAGTGKAGGAIPDAGGLALALDGLGNGVDVDEADMLAVAQPGATTARVHESVEAVGLFYPPDPNSLASASIGGNVATNAAGPRAVRYGATKDYVLALEVVTGDGSVLSIGRRTRKGTSGYDLTSLVTGSEGTLAVVTRATLRLIRKPEAVRSLLVHLQDERDVAAMTQCCLRGRASVAAIELLDRTTLEIARGAGVPVPSGSQAMLLIEIDGDEARVDADAEDLGGALDDLGALEILVARVAAERQRVWAARRDMSHALRRRARFKLSEDVVVPRSKLGALLAACRAISERHGVLMPAYGHAGDGNLHVNFLWDEPADRARVDQAIDALMRGVVALGGTLIGEHGIGLLKAPFLALEQSPDRIALQRRIKAQFDPQGILNPGKIFAGDRPHGAC